jgi:hypothetical protein
MLDKRWFSLALLVALLMPTTAIAAPVSTNQVADRPCTVLSADLHRWTPADGLPVRFIAATFLDGSGERWIGLGYDAQGFWSAEAGAGNDACDSCDELDLVLTRFDGTRQAFPVVTYADRSRLEGQPPEALREFTLKRLWHLAATVWPVNDLKQDYAFRLPPNRSADGLVDPYPGWMAEASQRGAWLLRFGLASRPFMCWCLTHWRGWTLAAPASKGKPR